MNFKSWHTSHSDLFWEMSDISQMNTDHIELDERPADEFDEDNARTECEREAERNFDRSDYMDGIYDDPSEDSDFDVQTVDQWMEDNPKPVEDDFKDENGVLNQEEFNAAKEQWEEEKDEVSQNYDDAVEEWEREMRRMRDRAEDRASEGEYEYVSDCVEEKRRYHERHAEMGGYDHNFRFRGEDFQVGFDREKFEYEGYEFPNTYHVTFKGPNDYKTTGTAGTAGTAIYTQLLLAIKKLLDHTDVDALVFSPAEPGMGLVYQRFYKQFLQKEFLRVDMTHYVRKSLIKSSTKNAPGWKKKRLYQSIIDTNREVMDKVKRTKQNKNLERQRKMMLPKMLGSVVYIRNYNGANMPVYLDSADANNAVVFSSDNQKHHIAASSITLDQRPSPQETQEWLRNYALSLQYLHDTPENLKRMVQQAQNPSIQQRKPVSPVPQTV